MFQDLQREVSSLYELVWLAIGRATGGASVLFGTWGATVTHADSPFTPAAGRIMIPVDTSGGAVTIEMPANPSDGQTFFVKPVVASATPITVAAVGLGVTVEDPSNACNFGATGTVPGQGGAIGWKFRLSDQKWIGMTSF